MRLRYIKLSGFKSFADVVRVDIPGDMTGVVGPNGCGKSNIIDAVRWVLGERSASKLRGSEMTDVIFNGSQTRKAMGRASVELFFDNEEGDFGGIWSQYPELSVKRELVRATGQSVYTINNKVVRLKDIQKIFMGTGLGAASYAIIGQGDISAIVEARPEDMRARLEEAAGVSLYRQRRQETENSLEASRRNLARIEDILREQGETIERLEGQAKTAREYKACRDELETKRITEAYLEKCSAAYGLKESEAAFASSQTALQNAEIEAATFADKLAAQKENCAFAEQKLIEMQGEKRVKASEIESLKHSIASIRNRRNELTRDAAERREQIAERSADEKRLQEDLEALRAEMASGGPGAEEEREALAEQIKKQKSAEKKLFDIRSAADAAARRVREAERRLQDAKFRLQSAESRERDAARRAERFEKELSALAVPKKARLAEILSEEEALKAKIAEVKASETLLQEKSREVQKAVASAEQERDRTAIERQKIEARHAALSDLEARSKRAAAPLADKVRRLGVAGDKQIQLTDTFRVKPGWEKAVEAALAGRLQAFEIAEDKPELWCAAAQKLAGTPLVLYSNTQGAVAKTKAGLVPLIDKIENPEAVPAVLGDWLGRFFAAETMEEALAKRELLPKGAAFMLPCGETLSAHGLVLSSGATSDTGSLARKRELRELEGALKTAVEAADTARQKLSEILAQRNTLSQDEMRSRRTREEAERRLQSLLIEELKEKQKQDTYEVAKSRLERDIRDAEQQKTRASEDKGVQSALLSEITVEQGEARSAFSEQKSLESDAQDQLRSEEARTAALKHEAEKRALVRSMQESRLQEGERRARSLTEEIARVTERLERAEAELKTLDESSLVEKLESEEAALNLFAERLLVAAEDAKAAREAAEVLADQKRKAERNIEPTRRRMLQLQQRIGAMRATLDRYEEFLEKAGADQAKLDEESVGEDLGEVTRSIARLESKLASYGEVNLAAVAELTEQEARRNVLLDQSTDARTAVKTLEEAIANIDRETAERLRSTYEAVNTGFNTMFEKVFGGGKASLEMTDEDILETGFQVKAQPPGKRNSTIAVLSGGEKALTAIALVLAIFRLNPAPFCLLDEVDAPLDEANQDRFARLVTEMSGDTQFILITHKRVTMEYMPQLIGVTMKEFGVSQVVGVDIAKAVSYASRR